MRLPFAVVFPNQIFLLMKTKFLFFLFASLLLFNQIAVAQQGCSPGSNISYLETVNLLAKLSNGGSLFGPGPGVVNKIPPAVAQGPSTVFAAGLWLGAFDETGNLKIAAASYNTIDDYTVGPLNPFTGQLADTICWHWNRLFRVTGDQIAAHLADFKDNGLIDNPIQAIYGWPGKGNSHFQNIYFWTSFGLFFSEAPFHDADGNGLYDPDKGDYPVVRLPNSTEIVPAQIVWHVFNDVGLPHDESGGQPLGVEVQVTAFAFDCEQPFVLRDVFFVQHKIVNRSSSKLDSLQVGLFVDFDLGCYTDDYIGCKPNLNTFFTYNQDNTDGFPGENCSPEQPSFGNDPPTAAVTFLNKALDRAIYIDNPIDWPTGGGYPVYPQQYYNYLNARWADGNPLIYGGDGWMWGVSNAIPTNYAFPDPPQDPNGWSLLTVDIPFPFTDRRWVSSYDAGTLLPGQSTQLVTAWSQHQSGGDHLDNVWLLYDEVKLLQLLYDCSFDGVCSPVSSLKENFLENQVSVFPNPAKDIVTLQYRDLSVREIRLFAADGRLVKSLQNIHPEQTVLDVAGLNNGVYTIQLLTEKGSMARKISVLR